MQDVKCVEGEKAESGDNTRTAKFVNNSSYPVTIYYQNERNQKKIKIKEPLNPTETRTEETRRGYRWYVELNNKSTEFSTKFDNDKKIYRFIITDKFRLSPEPDPESGQPLMQDVIVCGG